MAESSGSDPRVGLASFRTAQALDRTTLAWVRTVEESVNDHPSISLGWVRVALRDVAPARTSVGGPVPVCRLARLHLRLSNLFQRALAVDHARLSLSAGHL